jgi:hypothetical protein
MGLFKLTESERLEILNLHNNARIIKEQTTSLVSSTAPAAAPTDDKSKIMAIQTALNSKYGTSLKVDGILGQNTLTALSTAMKSKSKAAPATGTAAPAASTTAAPATGTAAPAASTTAAPATGTAAPTASTTAAPATQAPGVDSGNTDFTDGGDPQPQLSAQSQQALAGQLTPQQIRQQGRFDQRLARQARRNTRRAGQQEQ